MYRMMEGKVMWLVIKTALRRRGKEKIRYSKRKTKEVYKFPKGHLDKGEFLKQAALREVEEEGRIKAEILSKIGSNNYVIWDKLRKKKIIKKVTFFLMKYVEESSLRYFDGEIVLGREWLTYEEATEKLAYDSEKILLRKARARLEQLTKRGMIG